MTDGARRILERCNNEKDFHSLKSEEKKFGVRI